MTDKLTHLEEKLNNHLEIYAANGKESKRVADALERLIEQSSERDRKVDEMYEFFNDGRVATKLLKWGFGLLMALGGAYLMFRNIVKL